MKIVNNEKKVPSCYKKGKGYRHSGFKPKCTEHEEHSDGTLYLVLRSSCMDARSCIIFIL